jgi:hypothetical protein
VTEAELDALRTRARAILDQHAARVRDLIDTNYDGLATILHSDGQLADIARVAIGAVVLDLRATLLVAPHLAGPVLAAWGSIAEPGVS